jgi:aryl-alcohol dehydrogenase-like predicted oxidoreductase
LHKPDSSVPIADTLGALDELVRAGKVREIGSSNFTVAQIAEAAQAVKAGGARFVSIQNEYSLLVRDPEQGVLAACLEHGCAFLPYFPLASGALTGKYRAGEAAPKGTRLSVPDSPLTKRFANESALAAVARLESFAASRSQSLLSLAVSWLLARRPVASVIAGATRAEQVQANVAAAAWQLSADELSEVDRLLQ